MTVRAPDMILTSVGLCSSLGEAATACAAARAGLTRPSPLQLSAFDLELPEPIPISAHQAERHTRGFVDVARRYRLVLPALVDVLTNAGLTWSALETIPLLLCIGDRFAIHCAAEVRDPDGFLPRLITPEQSELELAARWPAELRAVLEQQLKVTLAPGSLLCVGDQVTTIELLQHAVGLLTAGAPRCLVGAVDSLAETSNASALLDLRLVPTPSQGQGLQPGEAATFVLLERRDQAALAGPGSPNGVALRSLAGVVETGHRFASTANDGAGLREVVTQNLAQLGPDAGLGCVYLDISGDPWAAQEWGLTLAGVADDRLRAALLEYPASSFGDVGCGKALLAACMHVRAVAGGYAAPGHALILASSLAGRKSGFTLAASLSA